MEEKRLTPIILTKFIMKVLTTINQDNFLTIGPVQNLEIKKITKLVAEFFIEKDPSEEKEEVGKE